MALMDISKFYFRIVSGWVKDARVWTLIFVVLISYVLKLTPNWGFEEIFFLVIVSWSPVVVV